MQPLGMANVSPARFVRRMFRYPIPGPIPKPRNRRVQVFIRPWRCVTRLPYTYSCKEHATEKKLAGAALHSFMTKCEKDAQTSCDATAQEKKLHGAAKTSFTKKCVKDATGA